MFTNTNAGTNVGSNRTKHTAYAKCTSIMRKLNNELEKEKLSVKKQLRAESKEVENV